jgi:hypothetical protein
MGEGRGKVFIGFWLGVPKARDHWEDLDIGGRIGIGIDGINWIQLAQDRVQWGAYVNTVLNLQVS